MKRTYGTVEVLVFFGLLIWPTWWFQLFLIFIPTGEMIQFDKYFADELKPPTSGHLPKKSGLTTDFGGGFHSMVCECEGLAKDKT